MVRQENRASGRHPDGESTTGPKAWGGVAGPLAPGSADRAGNWSKQLAEERFVVLLVGDESGSGGALLGHLVDRFGGG